MPRNKRLGLLTICLLIHSGCAADAKRPLVDPSSVRFPLVEAGAIDIEGTVVGQPRAKDGIIYFATREGFLTAVVAPARQVFWRFKADHAISVGPELGRNRIFLLDDGQVLHVLDFRGALLHKRALDEAVTTAVREGPGGVFFGTESGRILGFDESFVNGGEPAWEVRASAEVTSGPVFAGNLILFGTADGRLLAFDSGGRLVWTFAAQGAILTDPAVAGDEVYFGTEDRVFYRLHGMTGKVKWSRRLQGAPLHPALIHGSRIALAASNSVVYFLARRGGSILSWEPVPSRIVHEPAGAGAALLIASAGPRLSAYDLKTGKRLGEHLSPWLWAAGALWVPPFVAVVAEDEGSGRQMLILLRAGPDPSLSARAN